MGGVEGEEAICSDGNTWPMRVAIEFPWAKLKDLYETGYLEKLWKKGPKGSRKARGIDQVARRGIYM